MKYPSVTILITVKNNADTIGKCIDSLLELDYPKYHILVVDAFSNDGTYEVLKEYGKKINLYQKNGWAPEAYNFALDKIETEYIALIDGDNEVRKDWLKNLVSGIGPGIVEVAGHVANPKSSGLQNLLGRELEEKYSRMGEYIDKAPTMNVLFLTELAKKIRFNEKLRVGYDAEFSWELRKKGKIRYVANAIVHHYHRATWKTFWKQQFNYAKFSPKIYMKYKSKVSGGEITRFSTIIQPFLLYAIVFFFGLGFFYNQSFLLSSGSFLILFSIYLKDAITFSKNISEFFLYISIFIVRTIAFALGFIASVGV